MAGTEEKIVYPGDKVGTSEEWLSGEGTYEEQGNIYAAHFGKLKIDEDNLEATVEAVNPIAEIKKGDVIYGTILMRKKSMAVVTIKKVERASRDIKRDVEGTIHISEVSDDYTDELEEEFLVDDIVRAKVIQVEPTLRLSTVGEKYGVVRGYCPECRKSMKYKRKRDKLYCPRCEKHTSRKISKVYGKIKLKD